jgi:hypothetical protein
LLKADDANGEPEQGWLEGATGCVVCECDRALARARAGRVPHKVNQSQAHPWSYLVPLDSNMLPSISNTCQACSKEIAGVPQRCSICKGCFYCDVSLIAWPCPCPAFPSPSLPRNPGRTVGHPRRGSRLTCFTFDALQAACQKADWSAHKKECSPLPADLSPAQIELHPELEEEVEGAKRRVKACYKSWKVRRPFLFSLALSGFCSSRRRC